MMIFDRHTGREENHNLPLAILFEESEQHQKTFFRGAHNITLLQTTNSSRIFVVIYTHIDGLLLQGQL